MELTRGTFRFTVTEGYASPGGVAVMVRSHVVHIYEKAGVSTRAGAAVFAMEHGLIHPAPAT